MWPTSSDQIIALDVCSPRFARLSELTLISDEVWRVESGAARPVSHDHSDLHFPELIIDLQYVPFVGIQPLRIPIGANSLVPFPPRFISPLLFVCGLQILPSWLASAIFGAWMALPHRYRGPWAYPPLHPVGYAVPSRHVGEGQSDGPSHLPCRTHTSSVSGR